MLSRARALLRHDSDSTGPAPKDGGPAGGRWGPAQIATVGALAVFTAWTGGTAVAQVGQLALQSPSSPSAMGTPASAQAEAAAQRKVEAEAQARAQREVLLTTARAVATAALGDAAASPSLQSDNTAGLLDQAERTAALRSERLTLALRSLGLRASALAPVAPQTASVIKVSAPTGLSASPDRELAQKVEHVAREVQAVQLLTAAAARLPVAAPIADPVRSSGFGGRSDPFTGYHAFHAGQDFSGPRMTRIEATAPGIVSFTGQRSGYGNTVEIDHGGGFKTRYAHLAAIAVRVGQAVGLGDRLGGMGSTGRSTGTHLHYEVWVNGVVQNPERFLRAGEMLNGGGTALRAAAPSPARSRRLHQIASVVERRLGRVKARFGG